jgi:hypothetical protein
MRDCTAHSIPQNWRKPFGLATGIAGLVLVAACVRAQTTTPVQEKHNPEGPMKTFVIIFRQGQPAPTPEERQEGASEVIEWAQRVNAAGHKLDPRILAPESAKPGPQSSDSGQTEELPITALLFLEARDLGEAREIAASHPAVRYRARVEMRPWNPPLRPGFLPPAK